MDGCIIRLNTVQTQTLCSVWIVCDISRILWRNRGHDWHVPSVVMGFSQGSFCCLSSLFKAPFSNTILPFHVGVCVWVIACARTVTLQQFSSSIHSSAMPLSLGISLSRLFSPSVVQFHKFEWGIFTSNHTWRASRA